MRNKLVKDINEEIWKRFVAYCVLKDMKVGSQLNKVLEKFLRGKI